MSKHLLWIDLETTGLDPDRCGIIEIAAVLTTERMEEIGRYEAFVECPDGTIWEPHAMKMHANSGLIERWCDGERLELSSVAYDLVGILEAHEIYNPTLAGSSVHFDRRFIRKHMGALDRALSYRHLDVRPITMMMESIGHDSPEAEPSHRSMADIRQTMEIYRHWRDVVGKSEEDTNGE